MVEGDNSGDLICFQTEVNITQVDAPSSIMRWEMMALSTLTGNWKATDEGNGGCSDVSTWKIIKKSSEGSTPTKPVSRAFFWDEHYWSISSNYMVVGYCAKPSTTLYVWAAWSEVALLCNGPMGILGMASTLG